LSITEPTFVLIIENYIELSSCPTLQSSKRDLKHIMDDNILTCCHCDMKNFIYLNIQFTHNKRATKRMSLVITFVTMYSLQLLICLGTNKFFAHLHKLQTKQINLLLFFFFDSSNFSFMCKYFVMIQTFLHILVHILICKFFILLPQ
jgi:hypothetical protein